MSLIPKDLLDYANECSKIYDVDISTIKNILANVPLKKDGYTLASVVEKRLGLSSGYFSKAFNRDTELKANIVKDDTYLFVKLNDQIQSLLDNGYICNKIDISESNLYDITIQFTKNTLLGFYK